MKRNIAYYGLILLLLVIDQAAKMLIVRTVRLFGSVKVIPGFFDLSHIRNKGAIFGAFSRVDGPLVTILLTAASFCALAMVAYYFVKTPPSEKWMKIALSLILGGALGNLVDRVFRGYVIDFLELYIKDFHWPTFNIADSCITIGAFLLIIVFLVRRPSHVAHPD
jgi:signal peptidase II